MGKLPTGRRRFLAGASLALLALGGRAAEKEEEQVALGEDLMREHGVLRRLVEDHHEKLEEDFLFPRFEEAGKLTDLVAVLRAQHRAGRAVTADVLEPARGPLRTDSGRERLASRLSAFTRMYRPHASGEDTVLFPAFHELAGQKAYRELGEQFEDREKKVLGENGFEGAVAEVAKLETALGIHDLAKFTP